MNKYRIKLKDGRVIGPFIKSQIEELIESQKVSSEDMIQSFPAGEWTHLAKTKIFKLHQKDLLDKTFIKKLDKEEPEEENFPKEFKFEKEEVELNLPIPEQGEDKKEAPVQEQVKLEENIDELRKDNEESIVEIENEKEKTTEPTKIIKSNESPALDKTQINPKAVAELRAIKEKELALKAEEEKKREEEELRKREEREITEGATQVLDIREIKYELQNEVQIAEKELKREALQQKKLKKQKNNNDKENREIPKKKKKILFFALALALVYVILFPADNKESKKLTFTDINVQFPVKEEFLDEENAKVLFEKGLIEFNKKRFDTLIKSTILFNKSVEKKFKNNPAIGFLAYANAKQLSFKVKNIDEANTVFKFIQSSNVNSIKNATYAAGHSLFFREVDKYSASIQVVEDFLSIKGNKPSLELFAEYLKALLGEGNYVKAKKVFNRLIAVPKKPVEVYEALIQYSLELQNSEQAKSYLAQAKAEYSNYMPFIILEMNFALEDQNLDLVKKNLNYMKDVGFESSNKYYATYLQYKGFLEVLANNPETAAKYFEKSLNLYESTDLRRKLSEVDLSDNESVNKVIRASKVKEFVKNPKNISDRDYFKKPLSMH
jgi:tetratricopeptide (TPR) repeat protein